jgi:hypothetical protein
MATELHTGHAIGKRVEGKTGNKKKTCSKDVKEG